MVKSVAEPEWTPEQVAAITATGHTLLVANAGTGKTTTIVGKVLWLLGLEVGVAGCTQPCRLDQIAAITFTEKAAYDLKEKLRSKLARSERGSELVWQLESAALGTIHSFCGRLLREHALRLGVDPTFSVLDEQDARVRQDLLIREVIFELLDADDEDVGELVRTYQLDGLGAWAKGATDFVRAALRDLRWHHTHYEKWSRDQTLDTERLQKLYSGQLDADDQRVIRRCRGLHHVARICVERWRELELAENVRDFDSLILDARELLTGPHGVAALASIRRRYRILIIDEFQDTDGAQRDIAYAIAGLAKGEGEGPQLFLVGDPKQSIYRFRGADITVWNEVEADLSAQREPLRLSENFRSDPTVVAFVNVAAREAIESTGRAVAALGAPRVGYSELRPRREPQGTGAVEWIVPPDRKADEQREDEGDRVAQRVVEQVGQTQVVDPQSGELRDCRYADIAVLYRARTGLQFYLDAFRRAGIPYYEQGAAGLAERQEIVDLITLLRVLYNPADDLRVFAWLRSPFVGLRDEVLARIRLEAKGGTYLKQARNYLQTGEWFGPERMVDIEKRALRNGLDQFEHARELADRICIDELLEQMIALSGYRDQLLLLDGHREALANLRSFIRMAEQYRDHTIGAFLELWDERDETDPGIPRAQLYSRADNVVTFSTIHSAKGLEWPIVFLIDVTAQWTHKAARTYWSDAELGPILCPSEQERGARAEKIKVRAGAQALAEEARLLYVATTRARDRLVIAGRVERAPSYAHWLMPAAGECGVDQRLDSAKPRAVPRPCIDPDWLEQVEQGALPPTATTLPRPPHRWMTSATELMTRQKNPKIWEKLYLHGVEAVWQFAPRARKDGNVPERLRGTIIHGVLERYRAELELAEVLEETIGELGAPELEFALGKGSEYRTALEAEIQRVVESDEWKWYVEGVHYRELPFIHLVGPREWRTGSFDLYRPDGWIIDFKTHRVGPEGTARVADEYRLQMRLYREAAAICSAVKTQLHFTSCNVVLVIEDD